MGLFDIFKPSAETLAQRAADEAQRAASEARQADIQQCLQSGDVPAGVRARLEGVRRGALPWMATLTAAELSIARSHGLRPISTVSATCWLHYGWSWTLGHSEGWTQALARLKQEASAAGANAVLDVKMRTVPQLVENSMDFTLVGTAVHVAGLPASSDPIVATVPALEFVKLVEADVVPTGIAVGADYQWLDDWQGSARMQFRGNIESTQLSQLWETVRTRAHKDLRAHARAQGNGVLAHVNFSESFETGGENRKQYLARHIVVATTVDARRGTSLPHDFKMVLDLRDGATPLNGTRAHHQSYASNESEGAI